MTGQTRALPASTATRSRVRSGPLLAIGGVCGLAWAAALRGFMAQIAGADSSVSWAGTFGWILLPGVVTGVLLGWAEYLRRTGGRPGWRWLALSPLIFASVLVPGLLDPTTMFQGGIGGGAIGVPVYGIVGGYALSRRGPAWARILCGLLFASMIPIWVLTVPGFGGPDVVFGMPRGTWVALYYWSLMVVLAMACAIPQRAVEQGERAPS
jgi:hypothetical protein